MRLAWFTAALLSLAACAMTPHKQRMQAIDDARSRSERTLGGNEALAFGEAVHAAFLAGDYQNNYALHQSDTNAALDALDRAALDGANPDLAPTLVAWRALLLDDVGRTGDSRTEFRRSFSLEPNKLAGKNLVEIWSLEQRPEKVAEVCKETLAILSEEEEKLALIAMCRRELVKVAPGQELAWLDPHLLPWLRTAEKRAHERALAGARAKKQAAERKQFITAYVAKCAPACEEKGLACQQKCNGDAACEDTCNTAYNTCLDKCEADAMRSLPKPPTSPVAPNAPAAKTSKRAALTCSPLSLATL